MIHEFFAVGMLQANCSVLGDEATRQAMIVDPGDEPDRILDVVARHSLTVTSIVLTHAHIDHIGAAAQLQQATGAKVSMHAADRQLQAMLAVQAGWIGVPTPDAANIDVPIDDGDKLSIGAIEVVVLHTPGHSPGGVCLWLPSERKVICGDTLFRDGVGRSDLPGGDGGQLLESIYRQLLSLPEDTEVYPGHGSPTTIGREKRLNPFLQDLG
jgi:hydroxyacylglutathione hydrolase